MVPLETKDLIVLLAIVRPCSYTRYTLSEIRYDLRLPDTLPDNLPVIPLRKGALLPTGVLPLTLTRPASAAAAAAATDLVLVAAQREPVDAPHPSDLHPYAVLARVEATEQARALVAELVPRLWTILTSFPDRDWPAEVEGDIVQVRGSSLPDVCFALDAHGQLLFPKPFPFFPFWPPPSRTTHSFLIRRLSRAAKLS